MNVVTWHVNYNLYKNSFSRRWDNVNSPKIFVHIIIIARTFFNGRFNKSGILSKAVDNVWSPSTILSIHIRVYASFRDNLVIHLTRKLLYIYVATTNHAVQSVASPLSSSNKRILCNRRFLPSPRHCGGCRQRWSSNQCWTQQIFRNHNTWPSSSAKSIFCFGLLVL